MDRNQSSQQRDMVYCHQCENEWYRDEHGLVCPECQSDFTEIIEANHDPRNDDSPMLSYGPGSGIHGHPEWAAPDPEESDIDQFEWRQNRPGQPPHAGGFQRNFPGDIRMGGIGQDQQQQQQQGQTQPGALGGLMGLLGTAINSAMGGGVRPQQEQPQGGSRGTFVRHTHGPGYSFTFTTSTNSGLYPRDPNGPQPFQQHPAPIEQLISQMFTNIGAMPTHQGGFGARGGFGSPPIFMMPGGETGPMPFGDIFQLLRMGPGAVHGDAVYSQEALDRIITQLMEQHQTGNAPGPATEEAISSLPTKQISDKDLGESGKAECSICMDETALGATVTVLPCGHWFHADCIRAWLGEHDTCPHCRKGIMPKDEPNTNRPREPSQVPLHNTHSPEYHRPHIPGEYPFPRQFPSSEAEGSGSRPNLSRENTWSMPNSPSQRPSRSSRQGSSGSNGMFSRMREAFGGGNNGSGGNRGSG